MIFSSDQPSNRPALSSVSRRMLELREEVFKLWEGRVRNEVEQAHGLLHPVLLDTLPAFYDNIAESVTLDYPRSSAVDGVTLAAEHGGERARITAYNHGALIQEYQIFRWAIFDVLTRESVTLNRLEIHAINASVDGGIQMAVEGFSLVNTGLRERFAAALTHDLRTPLAVTSTALELVLMSNDLARIKTVAAKALTNVHRMNSMIDELLNTMTFHSGERLQLHLAQFDIVELVKEVETDSVASYGLRFEVSCTSLIGWWDRSALKRAFENLISNAVKYGLPETKIAIKIKEVHQRLVLWVHNEGDPIPPDEQECIFQMYRRAEAAKNSDKAGWGIGLPYVRAVAESHGGSIGVDSSAERGTTFMIDIPVDGRPFFDAPSIA